MFNKLKDKLKGWFSKSKETIEETSEPVETPPSKKETPKRVEEPVETKEEPSKPEKPIKEKPSESPEEKQIKKAEKIIEKAKTQHFEKPPLKFDVAKRKFEPDLEKIQQEAETRKKDIEKAKIKEKENKEVEKILKKDPAEILSEKSPKDVIKVLEEKKSAQETTEKLKQIKEQEVEKIKEEKPSESRQPSEPEEQKTEKSFFSKLKSAFSYKISEDGFNEIFDDLELLLLENNVALEVVEDIHSKLAEKLIGKEIKQQDLENEIKKELKNTLNEILIEPDNPLEIIKLKQEKPFVILFFGINGTGKTTSIAKIAYYLKKAKLSVVLAAGDTFRAASIEQIAEHAKKLNTPLIKHDYNADPAAVGFDAIKYAKNHKIDVVLIDTAGRMHTRTNLIAEMEKICRVTKPDLKIFVAESIAGNDATEQAKTFHQAIEIDGTILSKADIDEKGGTILSISHTTNKPIFYLGTGQNYEDLELFNKQKFIESLGLISKSL